MNKLGLGPSMLISAIALAGCVAEQEDSYSIGGAITSLDGTLIISDGTGHSKEISEGGAFSFEPITYASGDTYNVSIVKQPDEQKCEVENGHGTVKQSNITNVEVTCTAGASDLSLIGYAEGVVSEVTLSDGNENEISLSEEGIFSFYPNEYSTGDAYAVEVTDSGTDQQCYLENAIGTFLSDDIKNIFLNCQKHLLSYDVKVNITNLNGSLTLIDNVTELTYELNSTGEMLSETLDTRLDESSYTIEVLNNPETQACHVENGTGFVADSDVQFSVVCEDVFQYFTLSGNATGIYGEITLSDGEGNTLTVNENGRFSFGELLSGSAYDINVTSKPDDHSCEVTNGAGELVESVRNIGVTCNLNGLTLGGWATGITSTVELTTDSGAGITVSENGRFNFYPTLFQNDSSYAVRVNNQPEGMQCDIFYGDGTFSQNSVKNVQLVCRSEGTQLSPCSAPITTNTNDTFIFERQTFTLDSGLGENGFSYFDSNGNGINEILFGQSSGFGNPYKYTVIEFDPSTEKYEHLCDSTNFPETAYSIEPFSNQTISAGTLIAHSNRNIDIINHTSGEIFHSFQTELNVNDSLVGDIDNDGLNEIVLLSDDELLIYDADSFTLQHRTPLGGKEITTGFFTQPLLTELAINSGYVFQVADDIQIIWDYSNIEFGDTYITSGDLDGDGLDEIIGGDLWRSIRAYNADTKGVFWELEPSDIDALKAADTNQDGVAELIYADRQHGSTHVLEFGAVDGPESTIFDNLSSGVTEILIGDFDQDGNMEMVRGVGSHTTGDDFLVIVDLSTNEEELQRQQTGSVYNAMAIGDLNGDGIQDYIYTPNSNGAEITAVNGEDNQILWQSSENNLSSQTYATLEIADLNGDGEKEIIAGTAGSFSGNLILLNGSNGEELSNLHIENGSPIQSLIIEDVDNDGTSEIIIGTGKRSTGSSGPAVHIVNVDASLTLSLDRTLPRLSSNFGEVWSVTSVNVEGSGMHIAALSDNVYIINPETNSLVATSNEFNSLASQSGTLYAGNAEGDLFSIDSDGNETWMDSICAKPVNSLRFINESELAFTCEGKLGLYSLNSQEVVWQSQEISLTLGQNNRLYFAKFDGTEILLAGGNALYKFKRVSQD